jgi:preprotein translocase subunit SecG
MYTAISILIIIVSILLTIVVLVQNSKGGGLAANFASGNQTFGVRQTADFLEKATWTLAAVLIGLCILITAFISSGKKSSSDTIIEKMEQTVPAEGAPEFPVLPQGNTEAPAN